MKPGVQSFFKDISEVGFDPVVEADLVLYTVIPIDGGFAGQSVQTGVSLEELEPWPQVPPHWVHLPTSVRFDGGNVQPSPKAGWQMHSRQVEGWGDTEPRVAWASHVRAVLSAAVR